MTKRDVSNANKTIANEVAENGKKEKTVSDNISLFQSLRVLQEGESDEFTSSIQSNYNYCLLILFFPYFFPVEFVCYEKFIQYYWFLCCLVMVACVRIISIWVIDIQSIRAALSCVKGQLMKCHRAR